MNRFLCKNARDLQQGGIRRFFDMAADYPGAVNLGIGEPDMATPSPIIDAAVKSMREGKTHYTPNAGVLETREAVAEYLQRFGARKDPRTEVIITTGGMGAVSMALQCCITSGDEVLIQDPQWLNYLSQVKFMNGVAVRIPVDEQNGFQPRAEDIEKVITPKSKILLLNSPNNPTGSVIDGETLAAIAQVAKKHDLLVLSDEVYCELLYDGREHVSIASIDGMAERTVIINSLSKTFAMTGWRLGFAAGPREIISKMVFLQENLTACAAAMSQYAAAYALRTMCGVDEMRSVYQRRRDIMHEGLASLPGIRCRKPEGTFYAFPNITGTGLSSEQFAEELLKKAGVVVVPGNAFGKCGEGYVRISYANAEENLKEAINRMRKYLEAL